MSPSAGYANNSPGLAIKLVRELTENIKAWPLLDPQETPMNPKPQGLTLFAVSPKSPTAGYANNSPWARPLPSVNWSGWRAAKTGRRSSCCVNSLKTLKPDPFFVPECN